MSGKVDDPAGSDANGAAPGEGSKAIPPASQGAVDAATPGAPRLPRGSVDGGPPGKTLGEMGLQQFAPYLMNRIMGRYNETLRAELHRHGLSTPKMRTLAVLSIIDGLKINELAVYAVTEQSTLSRVLDAMEADRLIRRQAAADDNRVRHIFITSNGRRVFNALWPFMLAASEEMFVEIEAAEREQFIATLQKILRNIRKHDI